MSANDVIKKSFLEQLNSTDLSTENILIMMGITAAIAIYVFFVYRIICRRAFYSKSFAISLVAISIITCVIIMAVQSSVVISLGMVGALSIVRFRTAIKDPMDLMFLFWVISIGIVCGAGLYELAVIGSIVITIVVLVLHFVPSVRPSLVLLVNAESVGLEEQINRVIKENTTYFKILSKILSRNVTLKGCDMVFEVRTKEEGKLVEIISTLEGCVGCSLIKQEGEINSL